MEPLLMDYDTVPGRSSYKTLKGPTALGSLEATSTRVLLCDTRKY